MNTSHPVKLRSKTLVRLRSMADDLETSVSAMIKHAVERSVDEAWAAGSIALPVDTRGKPEAKDPFVRCAHPLKLEPASEERLQRMVAQIPFLKTSTVIRGAVERFVDRAHRDGQMVIPLQSRSEPSSLAAIEEPQFPQV